MLSSKATRFECNCGSFNIPSSDSFHSGCRTTCQAAATMIRFKRIGTYARCGAPVSSRRRFSPASPNNTARSAAAPNNKGVTTDATSDHAGTRNQCVGIPTTATDPAIATNASNDKIRPGELDDEPKTPAIRHTITTPNAPTTHLQ